MARPGFLSGFCFGGALVHFSFAMGYAFWQTAPVDAVWIAVAGVVFTFFGALYGYHDIKQEPAEVAADA